MPLLAAQNLTHSFEVLLYEGVCFSLEEGESLAILGASGSGKSTLLNHLSTLLPPKGGRISMAGYGDIYGLSEEQQLFLRQRILGLVFQAHYLFRGFTARENLEVGRLIAGASLDYEMLECFGIEKTLGQHIGQLSGGQQQRLSIARVLTKQPKVLLADEPTGNLDGETARGVMGYLFDYVKEKGACMVLATHDTRLASLCSRVMVLENKNLRLL